MKSLSRRDFLKAARRLTGLTAVFLSMMPGAPQSLDELLNGPDKLKNVVVHPGSEQILIYQARYAGGAIDGGHMSVIDYDDADRPYQWTCHYCAHVNAWQRHECQMCAGPRPAEQLVEEYDDDA